MSVLCNLILMKYGLYLNWKMINLLIICCFYFDRAIKNYYDSKEDIALATEDIETCETYVAKPKYDFPNELQSEINYMNLV